MSHRQTTHRFRSVIAVLKRAVKPLPVPVVGVIAQTTKDPFQVLISCLLSLRTRDETTALASRQLLGLAQTPDQILRLTEIDLQQAIYPVAFYRNKARQILALCRVLLNQYHGAVPSSIETLMKLPGVGRKTANLVRTVAYGRAGICVDTHVHRICNRLGWIHTKTPLESEMALRRVLPRQYWITLNDLLVPFGQFVCRPISPFCSRCPVYAHCEKIGVRVSR